MIETTDSEISAEPEGADLLSGGKGAGERTVRMSLEKIEADFRTPRDDEHKIDLGEKNPDEVETALEVFKDFEHPYDGLFVPKLYLSNSDDVYVVVPESGSLACTSMANPNHSFVGISPQAIVEHVFSFELQVFNEEATVAAEEPVAQSSFYWLWGVIIAINVIVGSIVFQRSIQILQADEARDLGYTYERITNATERILLKRHARGIFYTGRGNGDEVIVLRRKGIADFYQMSGATGVEEAQPVWVERRDFTLARSGGQSVLRFDGLAPLYFVSKKKIRFYENRFHKYEGGWGAFVTGMETEVQSE